MYGYKNAFAMRGACVVNTKNRLIKGANSFAVKWCGRFMFVSIMASMFLIALGAGFVDAFEQISMSTGAPAGYESTFLSAMQAQFNVKIVKNPLSANVYSITVYGANPNFDPPVTKAQLLQQIDLDAQYMATVDSFSYVYGWAAGTEYQNHLDEEILANYDLNCSTPTVFQHNQTTGSTFSTATCQDSLGTALQTLYQLDLSTPPVLGGF